MNQESGTAGSTKQIGELLIQEELITSRMLDQALKLQQQHYEPLGNLCVKQGYISEDDLNAVLAKQFGIIYLNPRGFTLPDKKLLELVPESTAREFICFPIEKRLDKLTIAMADPWNTEAINALKLKTSLTIQPRFSRKEWIDQIIDEQYAEYYRTLQ